MKRPFNINQELERTELVKVIIELAKKQTTKAEVYTEENNYYCRGESIQRYKIKCPSCDYEIHTSYRLGNLIENDDYYWIGYWIILNHYKNMVRMNGEKGHMESLVNIFGEERGKKILLIWASKNLLVAKSIKEFIDGVSTNEILL